MAPVWATVAQRLICQGASAMDFQSAMETFAEAWMAANTKTRTENSEPQVRVNFSFKNFLINLKFFVIQFISPKF